MFGYVKANKPELKIREYDTYCAAYCGLCRAMKKTTGALSCLTLNYDFVFLCLVRAALEREKISISYRRCLLHPLKKRPMLDLVPPLSYSAEAAGVLAYCKAKDDIRDSAGAKKLLCRLVFPFFKYIKKRADLPELEKVISEKLTELDELEKSRAASLDAPAAIFGELLGEVFRSGLEDSSAAIAYEIGYHTGKFIYAADAADDYEKDLKSGSYNPLCELYGDSFSEENRLSVRTALLCELSRLEAAVNLVDFSLCRDFEGAVKNIIYLGMPEVMTRALFKKAPSKDIERTQV